MHNCPGCQRKEAAEDPEIQFQQADPVITEESFYRKWTTRIPAFVRWYSRD